MKTERIKNLLFLSTIAFALLFLSSLICFSQKDTAILQSIKKSISDLKSSNETISTKNTEISNQIDSLNKVVASVNDNLQIQNESRDSWITNIFYPILLSIIAAIIFWIAFSYLPEKIRRNKLRPKLELDMYHIYSNLFFTFDTVMKHNPHSPSDFQPIIKSGELSLNDIKLGLQNKCLNDSYLYDKNVSQLLMVIGNKLNELAIEIDETVDKVFNFSNYLTADEILLLEKIRKKLKVYDKNVNHSAVTIIGNQQLMPVNPTISYRANNIFELYQLYKELQILIHRNKYFDRNIFLDKVQHYYYSKQFNKCKAEINKYRNKFPKDKSFLDFYFMRCEYMSVNKQSAYKMLNDLLKEKPHLVSNRNTFEDMLNDEKVITLLNQYYYEKEIAEMKEVLARENETLQKFKEMNAQLMKYYEEKSKNTKPIK